MERWRDGTFIGFGSSPNQGRLAAPDILGHGPADEMVLAVTGDCDAGSARCIAGDSGTRDSGTRYAELSLDALRSALVAEG
jgi:hypothetical protein